MKLNPTKVAGWQESSNNFYPGNLCPEVKMKCADPQQIVYSIFIKVVLTEKILWDWNLIIWNMNTPESNLKYDWSRHLQ